jgi:glycine oxidase
MKHTSPSTVIMGAGLMGRMLAVTLARLGHSVTTLDAGGPDANQSAARVAAAMLAPLAESAVAEASVVRMGHYALQRWAQFLPTLSTPVFFQQNGTLMVWHRQDAAEAQRLTRTLQATQTQIPELPLLHVLDAAALAQREPALAHRFMQGLYLPGEGQLDNRQLLVALGQEMQALGVTSYWGRTCTPEDFDSPENGGPQWLIDCRGLGAKNQWPSLRGVRGEVVRVYAPEVELQRPTRLVHPRYPLYIAPKQDHIFVIGATEIESEDLSEVSVRSTLELLSAAYAVHSGFAEARLLEANTQCRPTLPNHLPDIRQPRRGHLEINGLYRHGFMIAPALLDATLEMMEHGSCTLASSWGLNINTPPCKT